ncbi:hypothetical protein ACFL3B_03715 [Gemmatimonadota bacterium]
MRRVILCLFAIAQLAPVQTLSAQRPQIRPGQRISIRSSVTRPDRIEGIYVGTSGDTLYARTLGRGRSVAIPLESVTRIERWARQSNVVSGALYGALVGGGVGFVAVASLSGTIVEPSAGQSVGIAVLFVAIGAVPGAIAGALIKSGDRWEEIPLDRLRVSFVPQRDRVSFGLRIAF